MALSVAWGQRVINVPLSFLTPLGGSVYVLDLNVFRLALKDLEDDEAGMSCPDTHRHTSPSTLAGVTFARVVEIINGYTVTFENGQYGVNVVGGNCNLGDVINRNSVSVNTSNSAGFVQGQGADPSDVAFAVLDELVVNHPTAGSLGKVVSDIKLVVDEVSVNVILAASAAGIAADKAEVAAVAASVAADKADAASSAAGVASSKADTAATEAAVAAVAAVAANIAAVAANIAAVAAAAADAKAVESLALSMKNTKLVAVTWDANGNMLSGVLTSYSTRAALDSEDPAGVLFSYDVSSATDAEGRDLWSKQGVRD